MNDVDSKVTGGLLEGEGYRKWRSINRGHLIQGNLVYLRKEKLKSMSKLDKEMLYEKKTDG